MRKIGIIAAMQSEFDLLLDVIKDSSLEQMYGMNFYTGTIGNSEIAMVQCGVGKVNAAIATTVLISIYECNIIINSGIAGGLPPLKTKDVVIANKIAYYDVDVTAFGYKQGQVPGLPQYFYPSPDGIVLLKSIMNKLKITYVDAPIYSGDSFVTSIDQLVKCNPVPGSACEMEGAAIAQTAVRAGVEFLSIRYISDIIGSPSQIENYTVFEEEMAKKSNQICLQFLNNLS